MRTANTLSWLVAAAGVWQLLAPFILGYADIAVAVWNAIIVGIALIALGAWAALAKTADTERNLDWGTAAVGLWLVLSPFVLGFSVITVAMWNAIIVGIIVIALSAWAATSVGRLATR